jgi:hypothetical protein
MRLSKSQIAMLAAGIIVCVFSAPAFADETPPPVPPETPSIDQYVETVPTSHGGTSAGIGKPRAKPLPHRITAKIHARSDAVTKSLEVVATSSAYGAPQRDLSRPAKTSRKQRDLSRPAKTSRKQREERRERPSANPARPSAEPKAANALSAAVSAVSDSGDSHVFWLLAAVIVVTTAMVWATARRHRA